MKKRKVVIGFISVIAIVAVIVIVLVVRRRKIANNETVTQSVKSAVSAAVTSGYTAESFPLKKGMQGDKVRIMQDELKYRGFDLGTYGADGKFGDKTLAAVRANYFDAKKTEVSELEWTVLNSMYSQRQNLKNLG